MKRFFILLLASLLLLTAGCNKEKASDVKTVSVQLPDRHWYGEFFSVAPARILSCGPGGFLCDADQGRSLRRDGGQILSAPMSRSTMDKRTALIRSLKAVTAAMPW